MRIILLFLAIIVMSTACDKEADEVEGAGLQGKWAKTQTLISPGPIGEWKGYIGPPAYLVFRDDGTVESIGATTIGNQYDSYQADSNVITFYKNASTDTLRTRYSFKGNELTINFNCFEPCAIKLKRVK